MDTIVAESGLFSAPTNEGSAARYTCPSTGAWRGWYLPFKPQICPTVTMFDRVLTGLGLSSLGELLLLCLGQWLGLITKE
jgi:hypothetical protein